VADIFGFDIQPGSIRAVGVKRDGKVYVASSCAQVPVVSGNFGEALQQICNTLGCAGRQASVCLSPEVLSFANLTIPFSDRNKIDQILPFELDELIPGDIDSKACSYMHAKLGANLSALTVAMVEKDYLAEMLASLAAAGLNPEVVGVSGQNLVSRIARWAGGKAVVLDLQEASITVFICVEGNIRLIRSFATGGEEPQDCLTAEGFSRWLRQTLFACNLVDIRTADYQVFISAGRLPAEKRDELSARLGGAAVKDGVPPVISLVKYAPEIRESFVPGTMDRVLSTCLERDKKSEDFNFRTGVFRKALSLTEYKKYFVKIGVPVMVALVAVIFYFSHDYARMSGERDKLQADMEAIFHQTMPEVQRIVNPLQQLRVAVNEKKTVYRPSGGQNQFNVIRLLTELSARIPEQYEVKLTRMVADVDSIRLRGVTKDFNTVDSIQKELEKSPMFASVAISSANQALQNNEVRFELKLDLWQ